MEIIMQNLVKNGDIYDIGFSTIFDSLIDIHLTFVNSANITILKIAVSIKAIVLKLHQHYPVLFPAFDTYSAHTACRSTQRNT